MKRRRGQLFSQRGAAALTATIIVLLAIAAVSAGVAAGVGRSARAIRAAERSAQSYAAAEGGVEDMLLRLVDPGRSVPASNQTMLTLNDVSVTTTLAGIAGVRTITGQGVRDRHHRLAEARVDDNSTTASFTYAAQAGNGGVVMQNNSEIIGTIFSNGPITGTNAPRIVGGEAWAAGTSAITGLRVDGDAHAFDIIGGGGEVGGSAFAAGTLDDQSVGGNVRADIIRDSVIGGNAFYWTSIADTSVAGSVNPNTPPPAPVDPADYPISDQQLNAWEDEASGGGTWSGTCPLRLSGSQTLSLGPLVVPCDVELNNQSQLTVTGTLWIRGNLLVQNQSVVRLSPSFGSGDGVVIAHDPLDEDNAGRVDVANSAQFVGSGTADSFLMVVSRNSSAENGGGQSAIRLGNGTSSSVFFAPSGEVEVQNNVDLVAVTGWRLRLQNSASVRYDEGLANLLFTRGPTGGWTLRSWNEVE